MEETARVFMARRPRVVSVALAVILVIALATSLPAGASHAGVVGAGTIPVSGRDGPCEYLASLRGVHQSTDAQGNQTWRMEGLAMQRPGSQCGRSLGGRPLSPSYSVTCNMQWSPGHGGSCSCEDTSPLPSLAIGPANPVNPSTSFTISNCFTQIDGRISAASVGL